MSVIPILVLAAVLALIMVRRIGNFSVPIWAAMTGGAITLLITLQVKPWDAIRSVDLDVILFLAGVFIIGDAMDRSGYLWELSARGLRWARTPATLVISLAIVSGVLSAIVMNDTVAVVGTPLVIALAFRHSLSPKPLLLTLAFSITIGSVASPIGNPQNLLIALHGGITQPFVDFFRYLIVPTMVNMAIMTILILFAYRKDLTRKDLLDVPGEMKDHELRGISRSSLALFLLLVLGRIVSQMVGLPFVGLTAISLLSAAPILILSRRRWEIVKGMDWRTLLFFVSMFIVMEGVWRTHFFQDLTSGVDLTDIPTILISSVLVSQFISNVPFVALFLDLIIDAGGGVVPMVALAAGSTIAGNLTLVGAASNIIIVQGAERRGHTISFWEFLRIGAPLTALNLLVYVLSFAVVGFIFP